jgi:hypothetical protein
LLILVLLPVIALGTIVVYRARAIAPDFQLAPSATLGVRQFYLSRSYVQANEAPSACADGYHFASIWEIADPSSLKYNTSLGLTGPDSGSGPPTAINLRGSPFPTQGWVRTGYSYSILSTPGRGNCATWLSNDGFEWGTVANLPTDWTGGDQDIGVWNVEVRTCDEYRWVWCVRDDSVLRVFLPVVIK